MDLALLSQIDSATLQLELARTALESAKSQFEASKATHEELLAQAENMGLPKAKLKKLAEDRVRALLESGLWEGGKAGGTEPRRATRKGKAVAEVEECTPTPAPLEMGESGASA